MINKYINRISIYICGPRQFCRPKGWTPLSYTKTKKRLSLQITTRANRCFLKLKSLKTSIHTNTTIYLWECECHPEGVLISLLSAFGCLFYLLINIERGGFGGGGCFWSREPHNQPGLISYRVLKNPHYASLQRPTHPLACVSLRVCVCVCVCIDRPRTGAPPYLPGRAALKINAPLRSL